ncbi:hypothetical protein [Streptomyces sp. CA-132043]|uniref:hypothetical protein n=1 Tax=Streptomyces sp. CA-132043 TaxID=3240048 RepID=UPI003D8BD05B
MRRVSGRRLAAGAAVLAAAAVAAAGPARAADGPLLPHPGPDGLVWVPERTGDGGAASGGATDRQPMTVTVACQGGGTAEVSLQGTHLFTVDCPADAPGRGSASVPGFRGSWYVGVDTSVDTTRWSLTVTQPDG